MRLGDTFKLVLITVVLLICTLFAAHSRADFQAAKCNSLSNVVSYTQTPDSFSHRYRNLAEVEKANRYFDEWAVQTEGYRQDGLNFKTESYNTSRVLTLVTELKEMRDTEFFDQLKDSFRKSFNPFENKKVRKDIYWLRRALDGHILAGELLLEEGIPYRSFWVYARELVEFYARISFAKKGQRFSPKSAVEIDAFLEHLSFMAEKGIFLTLELEGILKEVHFIETTHIPNIPMGFPKDGMGDHYNALDFFTHEFDHTRLSVQKIWEPRIQELGRHTMEPESVFRHHEEVVQFLAQLNSLRETSPASYKEAVKAFVERGREGYLLDVFNNFWSDKKYPQQVAPDSAFLRNYPTLYSQPRNEPFTLLD